MAAVARRTQHHHQAEEAEAASGTHRLGAVAEVEGCRTHHYHREEVEAAEASTLLRAAAGAVVAGPTFPSSFYTPDSFLAANSKLR